MLRHWQALYDGSIVDRDKVGIPHNNVGNFRIELVTRSGCPLVSKALNSHEAPALKISLSFGPVFRAYFENWHRNANKEA